MRVRDRCQLTVVLLSWVHGAELAQVKDNDGAVAVSTGQHHGLSVGRPDCQRKYKQGLNKTHQAMSVNPA
jgi:hypothetical protein